MDIPAIPISTAITATSTATQNLASTNTACVTTTSGNEYCGKKILVASPEENTSQDATLDARKIDINTETTTKISSSLETDVATLTLQQNIVIEETKTLGTQVTQVKKEPQATRPEEDSALQLNVLSSENLADGKDIPQQNEAKKPNEISPLRAKLDYVNQESSELQELISSYKTHKRASEIVHFSLSQVKLPLEEKRSPPFHYLAVQADHLIQKFAKMQNTIFPSTQVASEIAQEINKSIDDCLAHCKTQKENLQHLDRSTLLSIHDKGADLSTLEQHPINRLKSNIDKICENLKNGITRAQHQLAQQREVITLLQKDLKVLEEYTARDDHNLSDISVASADTQEKTKEQLIPAQRQNLSGPSSQTDSPAKTQETKQAQEDSKEELDPSSQG